ncbi:uncharacterized protein N0V89_005944 [Didymosphaeria variabile]|uniref:Uncharacterized protein n=1 Tax=Didymosphaeria variabile TaxID=1932322 RepID=A0A9W8XP46_9PLEO|nr:uncharacterized protein N0V89_005944 [Didymosphaeria variabile]KAJ4354210.1 hypothetical protein N0V89_005944 [Didymosphaeria variabile]
MTLLRKFKPHKASSEDSDFRSALPPRVPLVSTPSPPSRAPSTSGMDEPLPNAELSKQFSGLHDVIVAHIRKFYSPHDVEQRISQTDIEHASTGIVLPWPQILGLLGDANTRIATLAMCIAWTILSRSLLLKSGISNSPGSTLLPPEIVECFQSFSLGTGAVTLGKDETSPVNLALLSRWKQISFALCHTAYIANAFSFFDARTVNIERALKDLNPLIATYALPDDAGHGKNARLDDLRDVLRHGASFAFTLFGQPCFWRFDWRSERAVAHGKTETELDPDTASSIASIGVAATSSIRLTTQEIVVWPSLVRIIDEDGVQLSGQDEGMVLGRKKYIDDFERT